MIEYEITCVRKDDEKITHVKFDDKVREVREAVEGLQAKKYSLYTYKDKQKVSVEPQRSKVNGTWFLTTEPDNTKENNLGFLPNC